MSQTAAPQCPICGKAHWNRDPHIWGKSAAPESRAQKVRTPSAKTANPPQGSTQKPGNPQDWSLEELEGEIRRWDTHLKILRAARRKKMAAQRAAKRREEGRE